MSLISKEFRDDFLDTNRKVISSCQKQQLNVDYLQHRRDSIQGTDYIVNDIFLNLRVFRTKIEHLKWRLKRDTIQITFGKFVTLLVQQLKILGKKLICSHYPDSQFLLSLKGFWTYDITNFPKVNGIMSLQIYHFSFSNFVLETLKFKKKSLAM